ncbi:MAG: hypothetical protein ACOYIE_03350 [Agathobaculum sp.]
MQKTASGCRLGLCDACFSGNDSMPVPEQMEKIYLKMKLSYKEGIFPKND